MISKDKPFPRFSLCIFWTMLHVELRVMVTMENYTIFSSTINYVLMIMVFAIIVPNNLESQIHTIPFLIFIAPGLVMMNIFENAFNQTSFMIVSRRSLNSLTELLVTPINAIEMILVQSLSGTIRGLVLGMITLIFCLPFVPNLTLIFPFTALFYAISAAFLFALLGFLYGLVSYKWEHLSLFQNYFLIPFSFLSGAFYSIDILPEFLQKLSLLNPFFYLIDGFRYSFIGYNESNLHHGIVLICILNTSLFAFASWVFSRGFQLRN